MRGAIEKCIGSLSLFVVAFALTSCHSTGRTETAGGSPRFAAGGPNADEYGALQGYPVAAINRPRFFVGTFTHQDQLLEGRLIRRADTPSRLARASVEPALSYRYDGQNRTLGDYLARNPTTGLLVARGDTILVERYQYARNDGGRRMFALVGVHGQAIYVDPTSRLVLVHTAVRKEAKDPNKETLTLWRGIVDGLGGQHK